MSRKPTERTRKGDMVAPGKRAATPKRKRVFQDPVGRYLHEHRGALGKDYKLDY